MYFRMINKLLVGVFLMCLPVANAQETQKSSQSRTLTGLLASYDFTEGNGSVILDRSGVEPAINLHIENPEAVKWSDGALEIISSTRIVATDTIEKLFKGMSWTGEVTIEAWIQPSKMDQKGPARIVTFSRNGSDRNFTLGQDGDHYDIRFRTSDTTGNGIPSLPSAKATIAPELTHVVYTRNRAGRVRVYINGTLSKSDNIAGTLSNWDDSFKFALGNELVDQRPWLGTYHMLALYNRALPHREVNRHLRAGAQMKAAPVTPLSPNQQSAQLFEEKVAPILAKQCIECHNPSKKKGKLDLTTQASTFAGDFLDQVIVAGDSGDSILWEQIESNEMPKDRDPLRAQEKSAIKLWIDSGAEWTLDSIDTAHYEHEGVDKLFVRRLTVHEYIATVKATLGVDIEKEARELLPADLRADGFSNTAYNLGVDLKHIQSYAQLAEIITDKMDVLEFSAQFNDKQKFNEKVMRKLIQNMGTWILRGPLERHEIINYSGVSTAVASSGGDYAEVTRYIIEAMLQSPRFIYRIEKQRGDNQRWPVSEYELASRLSYSIWGASPDKALMEAADSGGLNSQKKVAEQVERMLQDPRAIEHSKRFVYEWLDLDRLDNLRPSQITYPNWIAVLAADMRKETLAYFEEVIWKQQRSIAELFNAQFTYLSPELAKHYGIKNIQDGWSRYDLKEIPERGGLLTQGSLLTVGGDDASMVTRGLFILHDILRGAVSDPPPGLDTTPVPASPGQSSRMISEDRLKARSCGGCHEAFEPLAFALEKFDGLGSYQAIDTHGNELREDGELLIPGEAQARPYSTTAEMMDLLANNDRVQETLTWKLAQFSLGRQLIAEDVPELKKIHQISKKNNGTYASILKAIVMSELIQTTPTEIYE